MNQSSTTRNFKRNTVKALDNDQLQRALKNVPGGFIDKRAKAREKLPEFDALRDQARDIKNHTLKHLDLYYEEYEERVTASGGHVHWCETAQDACDAVVEICRKHSARTVTKGKSMVSEEIHLNTALDEAGIEPVETDLGEYIIQLRGETPSHIIAPAVHLNKDQIEADFRATHTELPPERNLEEGASLVHEARQMLRRKFIASDVGITGANMLIAETGTSIIVTNEGNGDLTQSLPKVHIVLATLEKMVPTLEDATTILRLLARSATGQEFTSYTTFSTGPRRDGDPDGPQEYHVIILDNGRSGMLGSDFEEMLRCIRCGACLNHCPVYQAVGGHAYGWVYPGPMGSVLTPSLIGVDEAGHLPNASTFCGRCEAVCPMRIPLPRMMRHWREREFERNLSPTTVRSGLSVWAFFARRPRLYRMATRMAAWFIKSWSGAEGRLETLRFAGGWTKFRDFPAPQGGSFVSQWEKRKRG